MSVQYLTSVDWDTTLADVELSTTLNPVTNGLVIGATKITTGAPAATVGKFLPSATVKNAVSGLIYQNVGTTAAPVWEVIQSGPSTAAFVTVLAGTASGQTTATRAYTVTGALATDVVSAVIRASTNAVSIQKATLTNNTLTVLFSGDPGASTTVDYTITRAA